MCFKFECKNHGLVNVVYYTIKQGYVHRPIPITVKVVNLDNTILFKEDDEHYVLRCKCPECDTENTIQLDEGQKNMYIIYTTEIERCNTESDTKNAKEFIEKIRKCCYSIITKEMIEELNKDFKKFKAIEVMQIKNKNLNYSISPTEFKEVIEELIDEIT